jgi:RNA polymerase sigma factor (TIGR02999 family)
MRASTRSREGASDQQPRQEAHVGRSLRVASPLVIFAGMADVTQLLDAAAAGDAKAAAELLPLVYDELRKLAAARMADEKPGQTLQATALVHEAYLRLVGPADVARWDGRGHFFAAAAEAMRRILIDNARRTAAEKRGGKRQRLDLDHVNPAAPESAEELVALDAALEKLAASDSLKAELVKLRFFAGLTMPQIASALGISLTTAERYWVFARTWLYAELSAPES